MATFNLQQFVTQVKTNGLARVNRFEIIIFPPSGIPLAYNNGQNVNLENGRLVSLFAEVSNLPPLNLSVKPFKIYGPSYQRPITSEYGGDGIPMTFHVDRDMNVKKFFDDWIELIVNRGSFHVSYQNEYKTRILLRQLDEAENITYEIALEEAFPRSMNLLELNNSAQNQTHRLTVIFAYRFWKRTDIIENITTIQGVPRVPFEVSPIAVPRSSSSIINIDKGKSTVGSTPTSQVLESLGGGSEQVRFENSTFEAISP